MNIPIHLKQLGFDEWFSEQIDSSKSENYEIVRITSVNKDRYFVRNKDEEIAAEMAGKMFFKADLPLDLPTIGDWVLAQFHDNDSFAVIHEIIPRKSLLKRKTPDKKTEYQLIAANIDSAFIIQSLDSNFNLRRLERYLVMINESNIRPVVLLSKSDLSIQQKTNKRIAEIKALMPDISVIEFSNINQSGIDRIRDMLIPEQTFCMLGSSGVGKTTLLNNLTDDYDFETTSVREKDGKGRHTTTRRQLISLQNNAMIIDTPGMREIGNIEVSDGINETFDEIAQLALQCFFSNCSHTHEKGCKILEALEEGIITEGRYQNYIKMNKEAAYNEMSYHEKRRKDKNFGKFCKSVMKNKKNKKFR